MAPLLGQLSDDWPYDLAAEQEVRSADGQYLLYVATGYNEKLQIQVHNFEYNTDKQVSPMGAGASWSPAFGPDDWRVVFVSNDSGNDEIWTVNRDATDLRQLTRNTWEWDKNPSFSPDGTQIVFFSNRTGKRQLYIMNADGSNVRLLSDGLGEDWEPIWVKP